MLFAHSSQSTVHRTFVLSLMLALALSSAGVATGGTSVSTTESLQQTTQHHWG